jgi:molybdate transport system substrate-binding protein
MRSTRLLVFLVASLLAAGISHAADIRVVSSGGFAAAYRILAPEFEQATGNHLITGWGPSMGNTADAVPIAASGLQVITRLENSQTTRMTNGK